jgi:hypothetical protein
MDRSKKLRKAVYTIDASLKDEFPAKPTSNELKDELDYNQKLIDVIEANQTISEYPQVKEKMNLLKEAVKDDI